MAREIKLDDDALRIHYSGFLRLFLGRVVEVPYAAIESVHVGLEELPFYSPMMKRRVRGAIVRGRFRNQDRWYLLDFRHRDRAVQLVLLPGASRYSVVGIEPDSDPDALAAELRARL